jgi:hypothetical protein
MKRISIIGVLLGGVVDIVSTNILAFPFAIYVALRLNAIHVPKDHLQAAIASAFHEGVLLFVMQWIVGGAGSIIGGYVAAWIAKRDQVLNGTLSSYLCLALGIFGWTTGRATASPGEQFLLLFGSVVFAALGGYLRLAHDRSRLRHIESGGQGNSNPDA